MNFLFATVIMVETFEAKVECKCCKIMQDDISTTCFNCRKICK